MIDKKKNPKSQKESEKNEYKILLGKRIKKAADSIGGGVALSKQTGIPRSTLEYYFTGKTEPKASNIAEISTCTNFSAAWLTTGEGSPDGGRHVMHDNADSPNGSTLTKNKENKGFHKDEDGKLVLIPRHVVYQSVVASQKYLKKTNSEMKPNHFAEAVLSMCDLSPEYGDITVDLIEKMAKAAKKF